jgi:hypothetical protein
VTGSAWGAGGMQQQFPFLAVERGEKGENLLVASGPSGQNGRGEGWGPGGRQWLGACYRHNLAGSEGGPRARWAQKINVINL